MKQTLTVVLESGYRAWCRELTQEQVQAIAEALRQSAIKALDLASLADNAGDADTALRYVSDAALAGATREAWIDIAHADREEG